MGRPADDRPLTDEQRDRADRLARAWLGYVLKWARRLERAFPGSFDHEQIALDALFRAVRGWEPAGRATFSLDYIDTCLRNAYCNELKARRATRRGAGVIRRVELPRTMAVRGLSPARAAEQRDEAGHVLAGLRAREAAVARAVYLEGWTQEDLAREWGLTRQRVQQLCADARRRVAAKTKGDT